MSEQNKNAKPLPKMLSGAVCAQMVRCGKPNCKCERGRLHGPFHYQFFWQNNKQRKVYIRQADVQQIREACEANRAAAHKRRFQQKQDQQSYRSLRANLSELQKL